MKALLLDYYPFHLVTVAYVYFKYYGIFKYNTWGDSFYRNLYMIQNNKAVHTGTSYLPAINSFILHSLCVYYTHLCQFELDSSLFKAGVESLCLYWQPNHQHNSNKEDDKNSNNEYLVEGKN